MTKTENRLLRLKRKLAQKFVKPPTLPGQMTQLCTSIREKNLTFLSQKRLHSLVALCEEVEGNKIDGCLIEAGCALGGSAIAMGIAKSPARPMLLYDTFEIIPPPSEKDGEDVHNRYETIVSGKAVGRGDDPYYGYVDNKLQKVKDSFVEYGIDPEQNNVEFFKGLLEDTMKLDQPVALAHIDVDWYNPVKTCLERIYPLLSRGSIVVLDDYFDWSGCRSATDDFLSELPRSAFSRSSRYSHLILRKR